jgi:hypothetical protein
VEKATIVDESSFADWSPNSTIIFLICADPGSSATGSTRAAEAFGWIRWRRICVTYDLCRWRNKPAMSQQVFDSPIGNGGKMRRRVLWTMTGKGKNANYLFVPICALRSWGKVVFCVRSSSVGCVIDTRNLGFFVPQSSAFIPDQVRVGCPRCPAGGNLICKAFRLQAISLVIRFARGNGVTGFRG